MKVTGQNGQPLDKLLSRTEVARTDASSAAAPGGRTPAEAKLESGTLQPAQAALAAMPEIDQAKVDALRAALARGEIQFDAGRLARLIQRFHGGQR